MWGSGICWNTQYSLGQRQADNIFLLFLTAKVSRHHFFFNSYFFKFLLFNTYFIFLSFLFLCFHFSFFSPFYRSFYLCITLPHCSQWKQLFNSPSVTLQSTNIFWKKTSTHTLCPNLYIWWADFCGCCLRDDSWSPDSGDPWDCNNWRGSLWYTTTTTVLHRLSGWNTHLVFLRKRTLWVWSLPSPACSSSLVFYIKEFIPFLVPWFLWLLPEDTSTLPDSSG